MDKVQTPRHGTTRHITTRSVLLTSAFPRESACISPDAKIVRALITGSDGLPLHKPRQALRGFRDENMLRVPGGLEAWWLLHGATIGSSPINMLTLLTRYGCVAVYVCNPMLSSITIYVILAVINRFLL
jgi:hypothetical protein